MDRGVWQATVHRVTESNTTESLSTHMHIYIYIISISIILYAFSTILNSYKRELTPNKNFSTAVNPVVMTLIRLSQ